MGRLAFLCALTACAAGGVLALGAGAEPGDDERGAPDGLLVLGVIGREDGSGAVNGERVVVADPRSGEARARRLSGGTLCHGPLLTVGERVVFSGYRGRRAQAMSLPLTLNGAPRSLGAADSFTPSAGRGRIWLGRWRHRAKGSRVALREVDLADGRVVSRLSELLPRWSRIDAATSGVFVIGHGRRLTLWRHRLDRPLRSVRDGWLVAAGGARAAWCREPCRRVTVWSRAGELTLAAPAGLRPQLGGNAAFSPDGARLALPVTHRGAARVAVVDLAARSWHVVPGGPLRGYGSMAWSPSGLWLYFTGGGPRVLGWKQDAPRAVRLPVEPGGTVMSIGTAP